MLVSYVLITAVRLLYCGDSMIVLMVSHRLLEGARYLRSQLDYVGILVLDLLPEMLPLILHFLGVMAQLKHLVSHLVKLVLKVVILLLQFRVQQRYGIVLEEICHREALIPSNLVSRRLLGVELGWEMRDRPRILA